MSDAELKNHFESLGYEPLFIDAETSLDFHTKGLPVFDKAYNQIKGLQEKARGEDGYDDFTRWPRIRMRTPKG